MASYVVTITHIDASDGENTKVAVVAKDEIGEPIPVTHAALMGVIMAGFTEVQLAYASSRIPNDEEEADD